MQMNFRHYGMNTKIVHIKNNSKKEQVRNGLFFLLCEGVLNERSKTSI